MGVIVDLFPALPRRMYLPRPQFTEAERSQGTRHRSAFLAADAPLGCLTGGTLAARFHAWHGRSGQRYVCSVYPVDREDASAGLPDHESAVVIGVGFGRRQERRRVALFEMHWADGRLVAGRRAIDAALASAVREWHVHLLAPSAEARRAAIRDLSGR